METINYISNELGGTSENPDVLAQRQRIAIWFEHGQARMSGEMIDGSIDINKDPLTGRTIITDKRVYNEV